MRRRKSNIKKKPATNQRSISKRLVELGFPPDDAFIITRSFITQAKVESVKGDGHALAYASYRQALMDIVNSFAGTNMAWLDIEDRELFEETRDWIFNPSPVGKDWPRNDAEMVCTFDGICSVLGIDSAAIKRRLLLLEKRIQEMREATR